jgi:hypothetical protein
LDLSQTKSPVAGVSEQDPNPEWNLIKCIGAQMPIPVANHTSAVYENKMYLFGGGGGMCENLDLY